MWHGLSDVIKNTDYTRCSSCCGICEILQVNNDNNNQDSFEAGLISGICIRRLRNRFYYDAIIFVINTRVIKVRRG
jgi:hypothetical protein